MKVVESFPRKVREIELLILHSPAYSRTTGARSPCSLYLTLQALVDPGDEVQAAGRIHRLGQTRRVLLKKFIMKGTVEEAIEEFHSKLKTGVFKFSSGSMPKAAALLLCSK